MKGEIDLEYRAAKNGYCLVDAKSLHQPPHSGRRAKLHAEMQQAIDVLDDQLAEARGISKDVQMMGDDSERGDDDKVNGCGRLR